MERSIGLRAHGPVSVYQLQAAIAALHAQADSPDATDWAEIASLYGALLRIHDTPVVRLNRAVAVAMSDGPDAYPRVIDDCRRRAGRIPSPSRRPRRPAAPGRPKPPRLMRAPLLCAPMSSSVATSPVAWRR